MSAGSFFEQPPHGAGAHIPAAPAAPNVPAPPRAGRSVPLFAFVVLFAVAWGVGAYFVSFLGTAAAVVGLVMAVVPFAVVLWVVGVIDRWEPEPRSLQLFALLWGGVAAVAIALGVDAALAALTGGAAPAVIASVVQAPIVEELAKGVGVYLLYRFARRAFDGPIDGVVYGALVGAGFAFTENVLYFATSLIESGAAGAGVTFVLRGVFSPFAHVMFTSVLGFALGLAARRGGGPGTPPVLGLLAAIALHAVWNGSALLGDFFALYVTLQVPLFALFVFGVVLLRREESRLTAARLGEYERAGWFSAAEVRMLATGAGRRRALAWAHGLPGDRRAQMRALIAASTDLAASRQRALSGRDPAAADDERVHLARAAAAKAALLAP